MLQGVMVMEQVLVLSVSCICGQQTSCRLAGILSCAQTADMGDAS